MSTRVKNLLATAAALMSLYLGAMLAAGISQLADAASRIDPGFGQAVFWFLAVLFAVLIVAPLVLYLRLPAPLVPPDEVSGPAHDGYMEALRQRLERNPRLEGRKIATDEELGAALAILSGQADRIVRDTAATVFVSTAVMQNGRLDGAIVLATQARMVWQVASVYFQRPSPRQMVYLYMNVGASALVASSIDDIDFAEVVTPLVVSIVPSLKGAVPGLQGISTLLVNSLANGTANAFLTLRVGAAARQYCEATSTPSRRLVRRTATAAALAHVGQIARENGVLVARGTWNAVKGAASDSLDAAMQSTKAFGTNIAGRLRKRGAGSGEVDQVVLPARPGEPSSDSS